MDGSQQEGWNRPVAGPEGILTIMDDGRRWKPRHWLAVASFAGTAMAAVMLGGPAYAARPQYALTLSQLPVSQYLGINSQGDSFGTAVSDTQGPIGGNP
jgi:hypothetical protein